MSDPPGPSAQSEEFASLSVAGSREPAQEGDGALVTVTYYTDPLCSWSWALEPEWRRLRFEFGPRVTWRYRMGGMIADWGEYSDPLNDVSRPLQMGPQWYQVRTLSGMPIVERIWYEDPPASSYPPSIAFKAAEQQGEEWGEAYLRRLREAVMLERRNIARREVLLALAEELAGEGSGFDLEQFRRALDGDEALEAFREDIKEARYRNIGRFPTLILHGTSGPAAMITGYRPYEMLRKALSSVTPELDTPVSAENLVQYVGHWGRITTREVADAFGLEADAAERALDGAVEAGVLGRNDQLYRLRNSGGVP